MKQSIAAIAALAIALTPAFGTGMERGPRGGGGGGRQAPSRQAPSRQAPSRPSGAQSRPAARPPSQSARPAGGGFNLKGDTKPASRPATPANTNRPSGGSINRGNANGGNKVGNGGNKVGNGGNKVGNGGNKVGNGGNKVTNNGGNRTNVNVSGNTINRTVVHNPVYGNSGAWGWNHGSAWYPAPNYWGGGFWGAMAVGATSAAIYGSIVNSANHTTYTSYQVQPSSPGATVLSNYQLQQTQCGGSGQVVIYGPSNSVICANPNNLVSAGEYNLDTSSLSLTAV